MQKDKSQKTKTRAINNQFTIENYKNTVQALKHLSVDVDRLVTQNGQKFDTTAANTLCQY